jgi:hypothetical protein
VSQELGSTIHQFLQLAMPSRRAVWRWCNKKMGLYYKLPVYKVSYRLVRGIFSETENFAREYKYTIGQEMKQQAMCLIKNIYRANKAVEKTVAIEDARENLEMIRLQLQLMQDFAQLELQKFVEISLIVEEVSKQLVLWERYNKNRVVPVKK